MLVAARTDSISLNRSQQLQADDSSKYHAISPPTSHPVINKGQRTPKTVTSSGTIIILFLGLKPPDKQSKKLEGDPHAK
jgi:hypothetical protein